jgi:hypothetical protein
MTYDVAGVTITIKGSAWFATFGGVPVFHAWAPPRDGVPRTRCGLQLGLLMTPLPPRHAVRIGRPCTVCWPELRKQRSLFARPRRPRPPEGEQEALELG